MGRSIRGPTTCGSWAPWWARGAAVRLRPRHRADAEDLFLSGLEPTVAGTPVTSTGNEHVVVTIDSDPAPTRVRQGRYLYLHPDQVEPLDTPLDRREAARDAGPCSCRHRHIFLSDDDFGVEVVTRLMPGSVPDGVRVADFGIRGVHLAYELLEATTSSCASTRCRWANRLERLRSSSRIRCRDWNMVTTSRCSSTCTA